ncbi:MAG: hypothetical protein PHD95_04235 [Candidatus ainarchaeum sp.]|nr:hypothetical protein [Candidatus ainarchaeum sp.]
MKKAIIILLILMFVGSVFAVPMAKTEAQISADASVAEKQNLIAGQIAIQINSNEVAADGETGAAIERCPCIKGDLNGDGLINFEDINPFTRVIRHPWFYKIFNPRMFCAADINNDNEVDFKDINPFVALLSQ